MTLKRIDIKTEWPPLSVKRVLKQTGGILAGGACRDYYHSEPINDYDIFVNSPWYIADKTEWKEIEQIGAVTTYQHKSLPIELQLIEFNSQLNNQEIFNSFDITCCQIAFESSRNILLVPEESLVALDEKKIYYNFVHNLARTMERTIELCKRGYTVTSTELSKIIANMNVAPKKKYLASDYTSLRFRTKKKPRPAMGGVSNGWIPNPPSITKTPSSMDKKSFPDDIPF